MSDISGIGMLTAFAAGIVSFLSPCVLPLVSGYISYMAGYSVRDMRNPADLRAKLAALGASLFFVLGFSTVFVALGASATALGQLLLRYRYETNIAGGRPANFLEIGGESYTKAKPALELLLSNPGIKSLVINFCGAFARTDVMTRGVIEAIEALKPKLPIFFSVHGTGDEEAISLLKERLGVTPLPTMDDACKAAVEAAA